MDRQAALDDFLEKHVFDKWLEDLVPIDQALREQRAGIEQSFGQAFETLWTQASRLQVDGAKGDIHYVYISLLRTGIMEGKPLYRVDAYDQNWFADPMECMSTWRADVIFEPLFRRMAELEKAKTAYARKVTSMDIDRIQQIEVVKYHLLAVEFMKTMVPALLDSGAYVRVAKSPGIRWMAGEFRDQSELLVEGNRPVSGGNNGADHG